MRGVSYLIELYGCPAELLDDGPFVEQTLHEAVGRAGATLLEHLGRRFDPQGVTAVALLAESHIALHTWPEYGYAAGDIFTCGTGTMPERAAQHLSEALHATRYEIVRVERGTGDTMPAAAATVSLRSKTERSTQKASP